MRRNVSVIKDLDGKNIVVINDIIFKGKRKINWLGVEQYLKRYIDEFFEISDSNEIVYIGKELPDEFCGSEDTARLKGTLAKAKANAAQGIPELIKIADNVRFKENLSDKHKANAKYGWYRYSSRFALPVYRENGEIERFNIFYVEMLIRHSRDNKKYLYDMVNIKKETSTPLEQ